MSLDGITVFVKVIETGGFSAAARALNMPKTTVSAKIAALEKRLGVNLIQRTTRKVRITEAGEAYFKHCVNAMREIEMGEAMLQSSQEKPTGTLKITAPIDIGHTILPPIITRYLKKYPDMRVELIITNRVVDLIGEGVDLAIRPGELKDSTLIAKRFFDFSIGLCATAHYLKKINEINHPRDLAKNHIIGRVNAEYLGLIRNEKEIKIDITSRIIVDDFATIKALTLIGEGVGTLPDFLMNEPKGNSKLVRILPDWSLFKGSFFFVYAGHKYTSPKVKAFIEVAKMSKVINT